MGHFGSQFFARWYIGAFLVLWGVYLIVRARSLNDIRDGFCDSPSDALKAVLDRRQRLEARPLGVWYIGGTASVAFGAVTLYGALNGGLAYALTCAVFVAGLVAGFLRMRNSSSRRAAALVPRRIESAIAWPWYPPSLLAALAPLTFLNVPALRIAAVLVTACAFAIMGMALRASGMAALLTGESVDLELHVDQTLRRSRITALWTIGIGVGYVFVVLAYVSAGTTWLQAAAFDFMIVLIIARFWPNIVASVRWFVRP